MSKATEQSVKSTLKSISKELNRPFNSLLDTLFLERILARIGNSTYSDKLIFKGGMCLAQYIELKRVTKDIDFLLVQIKDKQLKVEKMMNEIVSIDLEDGFVFSQVVVSELSLKHKKYPGYRISVIGQLSQIKNKVVIDIGVGDVVRPKIIEVELMKSKKSLFESSIKLSSYPAEYIFAEKLEAIIYLGEINSRMKDFYDCYQMIQEGALNENHVLEALNSTMNNRG
ncbi:nucleotidyl transferase AbiEii/AbiGii toxin family protein, partial [bacterium]|nr:nucleotidyl transferase AbiEii/AbiGii toxin family protein [bacterium]